MTLTLSLARSAARAAIAGDLSHQSDDGAGMHIALTHPLGSTNQAWDRFEATPDQWDALAYWCSRNASVGVGAPEPARRQAAALLRAQRRILVELDKMAKHPAYSDVAVIGVAATVLPAYRCGQGRWWPTTRMALSHSDGTTAVVEAKTLRPEIVKRSGRVFTRWSTDRDREVPSAAHPSRYQRT